MSDNSPIPIRSDIDETDNEPDADVASDTKDATTPEAEVPETAIPTLSESSADPHPTAPDKRNWGRKLIKTVAFLVAIGALVIAGVLMWPTINERYIQPVETTAADLTTVQERLGTADERLDALERASVAAMTQFDDESSTTGARLDDIDSAITEQTLRLDDIDSAITEQTLRLDGIDELAETLGTDLDSVNNAALRQLGTTRAVELMSRARLFLYQANYGLASADLNAARATLELLPLSDDAIEGQRTIEAIERLERAATNLPELPLAAAGDLDIAWQALLGPATPMLRSPSELPEPLTEQGDSAEAPPTTG